MYQRKRPLYKDCFDRLQAPNASRYQCGGFTAWYKGGIHIWQCLNPRAFQPRGSNPLYPGYVDTLNNLEPTMHHHKRCAERLRGLVPAIYQRRLSNPLFKGPVDTLYHLDPAMYRN